MRKTRKQKDAIQRKKRLHKNPAIGMDMKDALADIATSSVVSMALSGTTPKEKLLISTIIPSLLTIIRKYGKDWETVPVDVIWDKIDPLSIEDQNHE